MPKKPARRSVKPAPAKKPAHDAPAFTKTTVSDDRRTAAGDHVLYVEMDEEIPSIIDRVHAVKEDHLFLVVPKRALFLESLVNVKLLQREARARQQEITIVSSDKKALHMASQVGFPTASELPSGGGAATSSRILKPSAEPAPERPLPRPGKSVVSLGGLLSSRRSKPANAQRSLDAREPIPQIAFMQGNPNRRLFLFFLGLCLTALIVVAYFVLPKATVSVELESRVEQVTTRVVLADAARNAAEIGIRNSNLVPTRPVSIEKELTKTYPSTGVVSSGANASGTVQIINDSGSAQPLITGTRFRSPTGLIFRIQGAVTVPARASITTLVVADPVDEAGRIVGDRGNLAAGTRFSVPGLTGANRTLVYGRNEATLTGGVTRASKVISQADIDAARKDIVETLRVSAAQELEKELASRSSGNTPFLLLTDPAFLTTTTISLDVLDGAGPNTTTEEFRASAKVRVEGIAYDRNAIKAVLERRVAEVKHPDQRVASSDDLNLRLDIVAPRDPREERIGKIKANATLKYRFEYELSPELQTAIKKRILGDSLPEAQRYIQSLEQVGQSRVTTWPFWVRRIPGITSSIEVVSVQSIDSD